MNKSNNQPQQQQQPPLEPRWHYLGPDNETYGPYSSKDMLFWLQSGYFSENLLLRTENETQYHTLGEWTNLLGTHPFSMPLYSMESLMSKLSHLRPPMLIMPPGIPAPQFPHPFRFQQQFLLPPMIPPPHGQGVQSPPQMLTQQHPEGIDAGSLSHTPDSENEGRIMDSKIIQSKNQNPHQVHQQQQPKSAWLAELGLASRLPIPSVMPMLGNAMPEGPQIQHVHTETEAVETCDASMQTEALEISKSDACRILSDILKQTVVIN